MVTYLEPAGRALTAGHSDAMTTKPSANVRIDVDRVVNHVLPQVGPMVEVAHVKMTAAVERNYRATMKGVLPVNLTKLPDNVQAAAQIARDASIKLVENACRDYATSVRDVFDSPEWTIGKRWEDLRDALIDKGDISERHAELIARDQTLKLNGAINQSRQQAAGVDSYVWSTSGDERVRDEHAELDGETFSWASPPPPGHPGEDFQCRCIAIPVIPEAAPEDD
jgi:SPP1 gp7 family putative phage head morphogenesis protein